MDGASLSCRWSAGTEPALASDVLEITGSELRPVRLGNYAPSPVREAARARRARAGIDFVPVAFMIEARWFPLFLCGVALYLFYALAVGLFLATLVRSMPQFGLLFLLVFLPMQMLSGGNTPLASEPRVLQIVMQGVASTHFVAFAEAILFRGAGFAVVFRDYLAVAGLGALFFVFAVLRFRSSAAAVGG